MWTAGAIEVANTWRKHGTELVQLEKAAGSRRLHDRITCIAHMLAGVGVDLAMIELNLLNTSGLTNQRLQQRSL